MKAIKLNHKKILMLALALSPQFYQLPVLAAENKTNEEYQFNGMPNAKQEEKKEEENEKSKIKFKVFNPEDKNNDDLAKFNPKDPPFLLYLGYPRFQIEAAATPTTSGFKQEYNGLPLNFSASSLSSLSLLGRFEVSPNFSSEFEWGHSEFSVVDKDLGAFKVIASKASIDSFLFRFKYCDIFDQALNKFCYGPVIGVNAYPSLNFSNSTQIQIASIKDMVAGLNIGFSHMLFPDIGLNSTFEYLIGLRVGQDSNLGVDSDSLLNAKVDLNFYNQKNLNYYTFGAAYGFRDAKVHGSTGSFSDNWTTKATSLSIKGSYTWTFQQK